MLWHVIRSRDLDQATTREHHGTLTRCTISFAIQATAVATICGWVVANTINDAQLYEQTLIKNAQSCGRAAINDTYKDDPSEKSPSYQRYARWRPEWRVANYQPYEYNDHLSEGSPVIDNTSMMTTWVKVCQLSITCNRYSQFGDDLSEGSSSRSKPRGHSGGLRMEWCNSTHRRPR